MVHPITSRKSAYALSLAFFLIGLAVLFYVNKWWPGIMLVIGLPLALRQYLLGRKWDMGISLFVFIGIFITVQFSVPWKLLLPILFGLGGIYILFREFFGGTSFTESESEEDRNLEIQEEEQHKKDKEKK